MPILNHCPSTRIAEVTSKIEGYFGLQINFRTDFWIVIGQVRTVAKVRGQMRLDLTIIQKLDIFIDKVMTLEMEPG